MQVANLDERQFIREVDTSRRVNVALSVADVAQCPPVILAARVRQLDDVRA